MDNPFISYSAQADIIAHQKITILLDRRLRQTLCHRYDSLVIFILPEFCKTSADCFRTEYFQLTLSRLILLEILQQILFT